jgi:hypothetical protein
MPNRVEVDLLAAAVRAAGVAAEAAVAWAVAAE